MQGEDISLKPALFVVKISKIKNLEHFLSKKLRRFQFSINKFYPSSYSTISIKSFSFPERRKSLKVLIL